MLSRSEMWSWFGSIMSGGECDQFYNALYRLPETPLVAVFDDYLTPGIAVRLGASAPGIAELRDGLFLPAFDGAATAEQGFFTVHILHGIKPASTPTFHIHWTHNQAAPSGDVVWNIDYSYAKGYGAGAFPAPTTLSTTSTAAAQYVHVITDDDDMPVDVSVEPDAVLLCRIYRDPTDVADTFAADAFLVNVDMHYERTRVGTPERNRPFEGY